MSEDRHNAETYPFYDVIGQKSRKTTFGWLLIFHFDNA
jgi:hypothetical protein